MERGFTLVELMIVIAIIAILAAVAVPNMGSQIAKVKDSKTVAVLGTIRASMYLAVSDLNGLYMDEASSEALWESGTLTSTTGETAVSNGIDTKSLEMIRDTTDGDGEAEIKCGLYRDGGVDNVYAPFHYILSAGIGNVEFTGTGTDAKGKAWANY